MKTHFIILFLVLTIGCYSQDLNVMTFNIRLNIASDSMNAWSYRKDKVSTQVLFHSIHLLGVQEALYDQMKDMENGLPGFKFTGVGRDDGKEKGEFSAIFYDTTRLKFLEGSTFWLSTTPTIPGSKSWDAAITRIVTWAKFRDLKNGKVFYAFNTHFDHIGKEARKESAKLILKKVGEIAGKMPVIITGDFNSPPTDEPIMTLLDRNDPGHFTNTESVSRDGHYGPVGTFNAFRSKEINNQPIDFIFIRGNWKVKKHATISQTWEGRFASDHFAVLAVVNSEW